MLAAGHSKTCLTCCRRFHKVIQYVAKSLSTRLVRRCLVVPSGTSSNTTTDFEDDVVLSIAQKDAV